MALKMSVSKAFLSAGLASCALSAGAQDVVLKISTKVGEDKPMATEHRITAGSEVAVHSGTVYRIMVKPTVMSEAAVNLSFRVLDVASGETVSAPSIVAQVGQKASVAQGTEVPHPKNLRLDVTPSL